MENIRRMIEEKRTQFNKRIDTLEEMFESFEKLMSVPDETISICESNKRGVLEQDEVYNHPCITELDRALIELRTMKEEEYTKYLFSSFNSEPLRHSPEMVLVKPKADLSLLPIEKVIASGQNKEYLIRKAQEHRLDLQDIEMIIDLRIRYKTSLPNIFKCITKWGLSINQVDSLLEISEFFEKKIALGLIVKFCKFFYTGDLAMSNCEIIYDIVREFEAPYYDTSLRQFMQFAISINCFNAQEALDIHHDLKIGHCIRHHEGVYLDD